MAPELLVSVIVPAYQSAPFVDAFLSSVFAQTWPHVEVIVINDGSPDTPALESALAPFRKRIRYIWQPNSGAAAARNAGLEAASGELVAFLDADDWWTPEHLAEQIAFLNQQDCDLVYADAWIVGDSLFAGRRFMEFTPSCGEVTVGALLSNACTVITSTVVARRAAVEAVGRFDVSLRRGQDFDLWLRLAQSGYRIRYQCKPLVFRRVHAGNLSGSSIAEHERVIAVLNRPQWAALPAAERALLERRLAMHEAALALEQGKRSLQEGDFAAARAQFARASAVFGGPKLRLIRAALRTAPWLVRAAYVRRSASHKRRAERTAAAAAIPSPPAR